MKERAEITRTGSRCDYVVAARFGVPVEGDLVPAKSVCMMNDISQAFASILAKNHGPDGLPPNYGVCGSIRLDDQSHIELVLTFKKNSRYCCMEPGCHLNVHRSAFWTALRNKLTEHGLAEPPFPIVLHVKGVIEDGAFMIAGFPLPTACEACEYTEDYIERRDP